MKVAEWLAAQDEHEAEVDKALAALETLRGDWEAHRLLGWLASVNPGLVHESLRKMREFES